MARMLLPTSIGTAAGLAASGGEPIGALGGLAGIPVGAAWSHHYLKNGTKKQHEELRKKKDPSRQDENNLAYLEQRKA